MEGSLLLRFVTPMNGSLVIMEGSSSLRFYFSEEFHLFPVMSNGVDYHYHPDIGIFLYYLTTSFLGGSTLPFYYLLSERIVCSHLSITVILYFLSSIFELLAPYLLFGLYPNRVRYFVLQ